MDHIVVPPGQPARIKSTLVLALTLGWLGLSPDPCKASGQTADLSRIIPEFNRICDDLVRTREELQAGLLDEEAFADRILALFIDADSLAHAAQIRESAGRKVGSPAFAMDRGLRYLIDSLRGNYIGVVARNGVSFVDADRALLAAIAWRSGLGANHGAGALADAVRH